MTYGEIKFRLSKQFPGLDADLLEGWINDRYSEILGELPWQRQNVVGVLQTVAPYTAGSLALTNGSNAVTLTGGTFTAAMTGLALRVTGRNESYEFTQTAGTTGILDRGYEGPTASGLGYQIYQSIYVMPSDCRMLDDNAFSSFALGPLKRTSRAALNFSDPSRACTGTPRMWASYMDDSSTPPRMQVELYPVPDSVLSIPFVYQADAGDLTGTGTVIQAWLQPAALIEGATAKIKRHLKDYAGAQLADADAAKALANMRTSEAQGLEMTEIRLPLHYTSHRMRRWS